MRNIELKGKYMDQCREIAQECHENGDAWSRESLFTLLADNPNWFGGIGITVSNQLAGFCVFQCMDSEYLHIVDIAVRPARRRTGIGTTLMKAMQAKARCVTVVAQPVDDAVAFIRANGFVAREETTIGMTVYEWVAHESADSVWEKALNGS